MVNRPVQLTVTAALLLVCAVHVHAEPFAIHVVDESTSRGIPLVTLETTFGGQYVTDSNGLVAFDEPLAMGRDVFFKPTSHGYVLDAPPLAMGGITLRADSASSATIVMRRNMIAERLYRITGAGIYRDTVALGMPAPIDEPLLNAGVIGQDSALCTVYNGRLFWVWGDTTPLRHPLGNFRVTSAWSDLPTSGGLPIEKGINLHYNKPNPQADFVKSMVPPQPGDDSNVYWLSCLMTVPDAAGEERILGIVANVDGHSMKTLNQRIMEFDLDSEEFRPVADFPTTAPVQAGGHAIKLRMPANLTAPGAGSMNPGKADATWEEYMLFTAHGQQSRVRATYEAAKDPAQYTSVTMDLDPIDASTGKSIKPHACSIAWNDFRQSWTMILSEIGGTSFLGEVWYLEAPSPMGPWHKAVKIVTHDEYSIYNPLQHPELTPADSPYIYFEGTYTKMFSGNDTATPWYDYNQVMYRIDLRDERLQVWTQR